MIIAFSLLNSFYIPVLIVFDPQELKTKFYTSADIFIDFLFLIDVVLMFFKSYIDKRGKVEKDSIKIAKKYLKSERFFFDFLALISNNLFS